MLKLMKTLITMLKNKIYRINHISYEEFMEKQFHGDITKERASIMRGARSKDGLSRRDAAIALKINPKELKAIEKGFKAPTKQLVLKMARIYNVSLNILWKYAV